MTLDSVYIFMTEQYLVDLGVKGKVLGRYYKNEIDIAPVASRRPQLLGRRKSRLLDGSLQCRFQWSDNVFEEWLRTKLPSKMFAARFTTLSQTSLHTTGVSTLVFCNVKSRGEERNYSPFEECSRPYITPVMARGKRARVRDCPA